MATPKKKKPGPTLNLREAPIQMFQGQGYYVPDITVKGMQGRYTAIFWPKGAICETKD